MRARFAAKLAAVLPPYLQHVFLANSGAEAIDGALKFARLVTGRTRYIAFRSSFHGRTVGAVSLTWEKKYREPFLPLLDVVHLPYNQLGALETALDEEIAAVVVEIVQGEGGVNLGTAEFLAGAQRLCRERGALLIVDEIQTGFGRTGTWFGFQHFDLQPDIICLAKGLGGRLPHGRHRLRRDRAGGALCRRSRRAPLAATPSLAPQGWRRSPPTRTSRSSRRAARMGALLQEKLSAVLAGTAVVREVRGVGMMIGIDLRQKPGPYLKKLMDEYGVLALPAGASVLRLLPPLIAGEEEIELAVNAIAQALG